MEIPKLILEYIKAVVWPIIILVVLSWFRREIGDFFSRVKKADLPGGISIEAFPNQLKEAKELSIKVKEEWPPKGKKKGPIIPLTKANALMLNLGLAPSPSGLELSYYRVLAEEDPNLALAGLRIETETMLKNLAKGFNVSINERDSSGIVARKLREHRAVTSRQFELIGNIIKLCNMAIHGRKVTKEEAEEVLDIAVVLVDQYISWLSWGFPKGQKPQKST